MLCQIKANRKVLPHFFHMVIQAPEIAARAKPGRFILIKVSDEDAQDPLLRRPFSIMNAAPTGQVEILYKIAGRGTAKMTRMRPGDTVDVTGPFGNGFIMPDVRRRTIIVGGGAGIAPLYFLAAKLIRRHDADVLAFLGARTKTELPLVQSFIALGIKTEISTDDGSLGKRGLVTDLLSTYFKYHQFKSDLIYACGPDAMLRMVARIAKGYSVGAQLSLEENMACGVGACLGCTVQTVKGQKRVCTDGPVFYASELRKWL